MPYNPSIGSFSSYAALVSVFPASAVPPGSIAWTTDVGLAVSNGSTWIVQTVPTQIPTVINSLQANVSACLGVQGDSTSVNLLLADATQRWFLGGAKILAAFCPQYQIMYKAWDGVAEDYGAWQVLQAATGGERYVAFSLAVARSCVQTYTQVGDFTGNIDFRVRLAPDLWQPAATQTFLARQGGIGFRGFTFKLLTNGDVTFNWNPNPAVESTITITAPFASIGGTNGQQLWLRATVLLSNGLGGYTATIYKSTDGVTWTQLIQSATTSGGPTTIGMPTAINYEIGARGGSVEPFAGKIFETQLRNGIGGGITEQQPAENWTTTNQSSVGGAPTLYLINGSLAGQGLSYFMDATRFPKMVIPVSPGLWILNTGHNEAIPVGVVYTAELDAYATLMKARVPLGVYGVTAENPESSVATNAPNHNMRARQQALWGQRNNWQVLDIGAALWAADPSGGNVGPDGIHPTQGGYNIEASVFAAPFINALASGVG